MVVEQHVLLEDERLLESDLTIDCGGTLLALDGVLAVRGFPLDEVGAGELDAEEGPVDVGLEDAVLYRYVSVHLLIITESQ